MASGRRRFHANEGDKQRATALRLARAAKGLSQIGLAAAVGDSARTVRRWENLQSGITAQKMDRLREILGPFDATAAPPLPASLAEMFASEPQPPWPELGKALRTAREKAGLSQEVVADTAGVSRVTLMKYETGWIVKLDELHAIAFGLGMKLQVALWPRADASNASAAQRPPDPAPLEGKE